MSKPKNMTAEQEAEWKERQRARRATPEYKAKAAVRARRYYEKPGQKDIIVAKTRSARAEDSGREHRNALERLSYAQKQEIREKARERLAAWQSTERGKELNRQKAKRHYVKKRIDAEFSAFMANLEGDEAHG